MDYRQTREIQSSPGGFRNEEPIKKNKPAPPVLPKPKLKIKQSLQSDSEESANKSIDVRQAILRGSRNPKGAFEKSNPEGFSKVETRFLNDNKTDYGPDISWLNASDIASSRGQNDYKDPVLLRIEKEKSERANFIIYDNDHMEKCPQQNHENYANTKENVNFSAIDVKEPDKNENKVMPDSLFPQFEKQSNKIIILSENQPTEIDADVIRNCDAMKENIPESGHTENLLRYWKQTEVTSDTESRKSDVRCSRSSDTENFRPTESPCSMLSSSTDMSEIDRRSLTVQTPKQEKSPSPGVKNNSPLESSLDETNQNAEKVLDDILQELESFQNDILDVSDQNDFCDNQEITKNENKLETDYIMPKFETGPPLSTHLYEERKHYPNEFQDNVYDELQNEVLSGPKQIEIHLSGSTAENDPGPMMEFKSDSVTLIGYRKLNEEERDQKKLSSNNLSGNESLNRAPESITFDDDGSGVIRDNISNNEHGSSDEKKKKTSKQKQCVLM